MNQQITPAASAAPGVPNENMPDVIDSVKRLERVGSEVSKTTLKLIEAAESLSSLIANRFGVVGPEQIVVAEPAAGAKRARYVVRGKALFIQDGANVRTVHADRAAALQFSKDIADGLMDQIVASLNRRLNEQIDAIEVLERAQQQFARLTLTTSPEKSQ